MSEEDKNEHGRLICMKDCLLNIKKGQKMDPTLYPHFHRKELDNQNVDQQKLK